VHPDTTPNHQNPIATRDRIRHAFSLLGIRSNVQVVNVGLNSAVAFSPLPDADAYKLAEALDKIPELRPYMARRVPMAEG
jgi:hypothetical protein